MLTLLPTARVRNKLIDLYWEHFEHCARILHKPNFILQNQQYNRGSLDSTQVECFVPALLGVICVASSLNTYPECDQPQLHGYQNRVGAVPLLNNWYELIIARDGATMAAIQVKLLAMQIQKYQNIDAADLWAASAQLMRHAMTQRLHKMNPPTMSNYEDELRRALWLTILEQDLALAISCEMPPMCPPYTLRPTSNCDDHELSETSTMRPPMYPVEKWTDGLCLHILGTTFNRRLEAYRHRFLPRSPTHYAKTLEYARSLELILRQLPPLFRLDHVADTAANTPGRLMAQMDLDIMLRRPLIATYAPYARCLLSNYAYREATIPWVHCHLVLMCFQDLFDPQYPGIDVPRPIGYWDFFYTAYRFDVVQSLDSMLFEAKYLKESKRSSSGTRNDAPPRTIEASASKLMRWDFSGIMKAVEDTLNPMTRRIGLSGGDLRSIVRYTMLCDSLKAPVGEDVEPYIVDGMKELVAALRQRLEGQGYTIASDITQPPSSSDNSGWLATFLSVR